jgi:hypothetical protein
VRFELGFRTVAACAAFLVCPSEGAMSQSASQTGHYPMNDIAVTLASGTVVRIRNLVVFRSQNGSGIAVYIETPTPSTDTDRLALEAKEIAALQLKPQTLGNVTRVRVAVCYTRGCSEMREKPQETFSFVRKSDGSLEADKPPSAEAAGVDDPMMRLANFFVGERREPVCGSKPAEGEWIWYEGGDYCEWMTPARGRIVAQRDEQHRVHAVLLNRQTNSEADAHEILESFAAMLRSFGLTGRECEPGSSPAGAIRSWLYEDRRNMLVHISEITPRASPPRLLAMAVDTPDSFPRTLCP